MKMMSDIVPRVVAALALTISASCAAEVITVSIGCSAAQERSWPDDDECQCILGVCRTEE